MRPKTLGPPRDHYWKVTDMAQAIGVPLVDLWTAGDLTTQEHAAMIERCRRCQKPDACTKRLARRTKLSEPPRFCENRQSFHGLSRNPSSADHASDRRGEA